jgi:hypothetical protein
VLLLLHKTIPFICAAVRAVSNRLNWERDFIMGMFYYIWAALVVQTMKYFKRTLLIAPSLLTLRNLATVSTVALLVMPKSFCVEALPPPPGRKKDDEHQNFFKMFADKIPPHVKNDFNEILGSAAGSLKSSIESGVPGQVGVLLACSLLYS